MNVVVCDLMSALAAASMDLIVSNPPYVPRSEEEGLQREVRDWEPHVALFAGDSGFEIYERIVADAARVLLPRRLARDGAGLRQPHAGLGDAGRMAGRPCRAGPGRYPESHCCADCAALTPAVRRMLEYARRTLRLQTHLRQTISKRIARQT